MNTKNYMLIQNIPHARKLYDLGLLKSNVTILIDHITTKEYVFFSITRWGIQCRPSQSGTPINFDLMINTGRFYFEV